MLQHGRRESLSAEGSGDEEAHHRPDRAIVDAGQSPRVLEPRIVFARGERAPGGRLLPDIAEQTGRRPSPHEALQPPPMAFAQSGLVLGAAEARVHAPTSSARAPRTEQTLEVAPTIGG